MISGRYGVSCNSKSAGNEYCYGRVDFNAEQTYSGVSLTNSSARDASDLSVVAMDPWGFEFRFELSDAGTYDMSYYFFDWELTA